MKNERLRLVGIDYGSKLAGTTVLAFLEDNGAATTIQSTAKKDADAFILQQLQKRVPSQVFIDAPLSLPGKYRYPQQYDDFFYRRADRELKAMSPMFLGGLTARAMKLQEALLQQEHEVREVYPGALARQLQLADWQYKKQKSHLPAFLEYFQSLLPFSIDPTSIHSWHQVDALLALFTAFRFLAGEHQTLGDPQEGQIII